MDKMLLQVKKKQKTKQNNKVKRVLESLPPPQKKEKDNKIKSRKLVAPKFKNYMHLKTHPS